MKLEIAEQISRLMDAFGSSAATVSEGLIEDMIRVADDYPASLVERVVEKYRLGMVPGQSLDFPPKLPQFASSLRSEPLRIGEPGYVSPEQHRKMIYEQNKIEAPQHDDAKKARIREMLARFHADRRAPDGNGRIGP